MTQWLGAPSGLGQGREILPEWGDTMLLQTSLNLCLPTFLMCVYIYTRMCVCMYVQASRVGYASQQPRQVETSLQRGEERCMYRCTYIFVCQHATMPSMYVRVRLVSISENEGIYVYAYICQCLGSSSGQKPASQMSIHLSVSL